MSTDQPAPKAALNLAPKPHWDQTEFEKFQSGFSRLRRWQDGRKLRKIFALAAASPQLAEELDWAQKHGVRFYVDHQVKDLGGAYLIGTGVMAVAEDVLKKPELAVRVLAHEIRHAWQDYNSLTKDFYAQSLEDYFGTTALTEADADAFGSLARNQYRITQQMRKSAALPEYLHRDEEAVLQICFMRWFSDSEVMPFYGSRAAQEYASLRDIPDVDKGDLEKPGGRTEFLPEVKSFPHSKLSLRREADIKPLGAGFDGTKNYLTGLQPGFLKTTPMRPTLINDFSWAMDGEQQRRIAAICKADIGRKEVKSMGRQP